jgi:TonB family protein
MAGSRIVLVAALSSLFAAPAAAQQDGPPGWRMHWANDYCTLVRLQDPETPFTIAFRTLPGREDPSLFLARGTEALPPQAGTVTLGPSGRSFELSIGSDFRADGTELPLLGRLPGDFWDALASSDQIQIRMGSEMAAQIYLTGTSTAVGALRQCVSDALREWGVDEAALAALRRRPVSTNSNGIDSYDYPHQAVVQNIQGRVVMRILVSAEGRATACVPVATSHTPIFNDAACHAVLTRGRYVPALDAAGHPTAAQFVTTVAFFMPD